jgi:hypothetical protein
MAREVTINTWCDNHLKRHEERVPGEEVIVALGELGIHKQLTLALCEPCRKEFYEPLRELLWQYGQRVGAGDEPVTQPSKRVRPAPEEWLDCPAPGCNHRSPNKNALGSHVRSMHDTTLAELLGAPTPFKCPDCDRAFTAPQGLGVHRQRVHGVDGKDSHPARQSETLV